MTLVLWVILVAFGGGCLAWYCSSVRYFPDIRWDQALSYLGVLSIIGGVLVVGFGFLAFVPGVIWSELLISDRTLWPSLSYRRHHDQRERCLIRVLIVIAVPFAVFMFPTHMLMFSIHLPAVLVAISQYAPGGSNSRREGQRQLHSNTNTLDPSGSLSKSQVYSRLRSVCHARPDVSRGHPPYHPRRKTSMVVGALLHRGSGRRQRVRFHALWDPAVGGSLGCRIRNFPTPRHRRMVRRKNQPLAPSNGVVWLW
jgi:hypothetical protein